MIQGKKWNQLSLLELTKPRKLFRKSILNLRMSSKLEYFPTAIVQSDKTHESSWLITPENNIKTLWDVFSIFIIILQSIYIPFTLSFEFEEGLVWFISDTLSTIFFVFDMLLSLNLAVYQHGVLITERKSIVKIYLKTWFLIDIFAIFPYFLTFLSDNSILGPLRLFKLLRLFKINKLLLEIEEKIASKLLSSALMLFEILCNVLYCSHILACIFFAIGSHDSKRYPEVWLTTCYLESSSLLELYVTSLYWSITTLATVGYGDIKPQTPSEIGFVLISMVASCLVFGYVIGAIEGIVLEYTAMETKHRNILVNLNNFMDKHQIPNCLRSKVRRYLKYTRNIQKKSEIDESEILGLFSNELQELICIYSRGHIFNNFFIFNRFEQKFLKKVAMVVMYNCYAPNDLIFEEGQKSRELYFVHEGQVSLEDLNSGCVFKTIEKFSYFGEIAFFLAATRCCSARSLTFLETLIISWKSFENILREDVDAREFVNKLQEEPMNEALHDMGIECYFCKCIGHLAKDCEIIGHGKSDIKKNWISSRGLAKKIKPTSIDSESRLIYPKFLKFHSKRFENVESFSEIIGKEKKLSIKKKADLSLYSESSESNVDVESSIRSIEFDSALIKQASFQDYF